MAGVVVELRIHASTEDLAMTDLRGELKELKNQYYREHPYCMTGTGRYIHDAYPSGGPVCHLYGDVRHELKTDRGYPICSRCEDINRRKLSTGDRSYRLRDGWRAACLGTAYDSDSVVRPMLKYKMVSVDRNTHWIAHELSSNGEKWPSGGGREKQYAHLTEMEKHQLETGLLEIHTIVPNWYMEVPQFKLKRIAPASRIPVNTAPQAPSSNVRPNTVVTITTTTTTTVLG